jgi:hypothetical protein
VGARGVRAGNGGVVKEVKNEGLRDSAELRRVQLLLSSFTPATHARKGLRTLSLFRILHSSDSTQRTQRAQRRGREGGPEEFGRGTAAS